MCAYCPSTTIRAVHTCRAGREGKREAVASWPLASCTHTVRCHASHRCKLATRREEWGGGGGGGGQKFCCVTGPKVSESFTIAEFLGCL